MTILFSGLGVAFVAFCIWLTVRIVNRRERWAKWTLAAVVGVPVLYVAIFGPACWISSRTGIGSRAVSVVYQPMLRLCMRDTYLAAAFWWYASIGTKDGIYTARDAERSIHIQWEPFRIDFIGVSAGDQDQDLPPISDTLIEPAMGLDLPTETGDSTP
jgi:hypothetical protein